MSRYIKLADALRALADTCYLDEIDENMQRLSSIDIVRCKDCKHYDTDVWTARHWCGRASSIGNCKYVNPDDFCSYGERREP